jgi:hypothetical protein
MVRIRERLAELDERAGLTGNRWPTWFSVLLILILLILLGLGIARGDQEVIVGTALILGLFISTRRMNR